jgi:phosphomannomutase
MAMATARFWPMTQGALSPGDILGQITARVVPAEAIVTPVTSNSGAEASGSFARVVRTKVGSPFVIAGMASAGGRVAGCEANGGFLLGFDAVLAGPLSRLMTRDSLLPLVAVMAAAKGQPLSVPFTAEPLRFTAADRIERVRTERSAALVARLTADAGAARDLLAALGEAPAMQNPTDGLRLTCASGTVIHLRPSGNAPELRAYVEADDPDRAASMLCAAMNAVAERV